MLDTLAILHCTIMPPTQQLGHPLFGLFNENKEDLSKPMR